MIKKTRRAPIMKRVVSKYAKEPPHLQVDEFELSCTAEDMKHLFDVEDDDQMIYLYKIKTDEQIEFFRSKGVPIDDQGYFYVECYEE
jgi:hypothetical protein